MCLFFFFPSKWNSCFPASPGLKLLKQKARHAAGGFPMVEAVVEKAWTIPSKPHQRKPVAGAATPSNGRGGGAAPEGKPRPWHMCPSEAEEQIAPVRDVPACTLAPRRTRLNPGLGCQGCCVQRSPPREPEALLGGDSCSVCAG